MLYIIDTEDNRAFPVETSSGKIELQDKPIARPLKVIAYREYERLERALALASSELVTLRAIAAAKRYLGER